MRVRILRNPSRDVAKAIAGEYPDVPADGVGALREGQVRDLPNKVAERLLDPGHLLAEITTDPIRDVPTEAERLAIEAEDYDERLKRFRARQAEDINAAAPKAKAAETNPKKA